MVAPQIVLARHLLRRPVRVILLHIDCRRSLFDFCRCRTTRGFRTALFYHKFFDWSHSMGVHVHLVGALRLHEWYHVSCSFVYESDISRGASWYIVQLSQRSRVFLPFEHERNPHERISQTLYATASDRAAAFAGSAAERKSHTFSYPCFSCSATCSPLRSPAEIGPGTDDAYGLPELVFDNISGAQSRRRTQVMHESQEAERVLGNELFLLPFGGPSHAVDLEPNHHR